MNTKAGMARSRKEALLRDLLASPTALGNFFMLHADAVFNGSVRQGEEGPIHVLQYTDTWTGHQQRTEFKSEVEMLAFMGDYLKDSDGPSEEFMKRFPDEFDPPSPPRWNS